MAMIKCKECKTEVSSKAKICPSCGVKDPGVKAKEVLGGLLILSLLVWVASWLFGGDSTQEPPKPHAEVNQTFEVKNGTPQKYHIIGNSDYSFAGRTRLDVYISSPNALSLEDRAATVQQAAKDYLHQKRANQVTAFLEVGNKATNNRGKGDHLAIATYTPDGCGNSGDDCTGQAWEIEASGQQFPNGKVTEFISRTMLTK